MLKHDVSSVALGERLRSLRKLRGLSLEEAGRRLELSASFLSMLERGRTDVSLGRFERICRVYGIQAGELLLEHGQGLEPEIRAISEAPAIDRGVGVSYRLVRREPPQVMHVEFAPRAAFEDLRAHHGEDFAIVLRGRVELLYGSERHLVLAGETVRFPGAEPHGLANASDLPATVVIVTTEPYW
jgi:transcriptional regulator with XRE-family HTH domain